MQCSECLLYWNQGIVYCTCGHLLRESESNQHFHQWRLDALSIANYVIKKGRPRGARHAKTEAQKEHFIAHNARRRCIKKNFKGIHDRFQKDLTYRASQLKIGWTEEKCIEMEKLAQKYHCQWTLLRGRKPKWIFHNSGNLLQPLELIPDSRKHEVPTEWQVRTVLGNCISRARVVSIQAPHYRQHALISDFLDLANLSTREEAALATDWIKDRPEGLKLQNLAVATMTGPAMSSLPENMTADVQYAINKCESLGSGKQLILHEPIGNCSGFFPAYGSLSSSFFCRICNLIAVDSPGHPPWQFRHLCGQR